MRELSRFAISAREEDFVIHLEDSAGEKMDFCATPDQLDAVIGALDDMLAENEEAIFGVQDSGASLHRPIS